MTTLRLMPLVGLLAAVTACGQQPLTVGGDPAETPLTVNDWKALPAASKYEIDTLERLKAGEPKLRETRAWEKFTREVLLPAKKKEQSARPNP